MYLCLSFISLVFVDIVFHTRLVLFLMKRVKFYRLFVRKLVVQLDFVIKAAITVFLCKISDVHIPLFVFEL